MFEYAVKVAKEMADDYETYAIDGKGCSRKCDKTWLWACPLFKALKIEVMYLDEGVSEPAMPGTVIKKTDGSFVIILRRDLGSAFERFVFCKELFEIVLDHPSSHQLDLNKHLNATLFSANEVLPLHAVQEYASVVAAAEFLFPHAHRVKIIAAGKADQVEAIAKQYDIPPEMVEWWLSDYAMERYNPDVQP